MCVCCEWWFNLFLKRTWKIFLATLSGNTEWIWWRSVPAKLKFQENGEKSTPAKLTRVDLTEKQMSPLVFQCFFIPRDNGMLVFLCVLFCFVYKKTVQLCFSLKLTAWFLCLSQHFMQVNLQRIEKWMYSKCREVYFWTPLGNLIVCGPISVTKISQPCLNWKIETQV